MGQAIFDNIRSGWGVEMDLKEKERSGRVKLE